MGVGFSFNGTNGKGFLEAFQPRIASGESGRWEGLDTVSSSLPSREMGGIMMS